jgi:DNA-damage-inducible protein J
MHVAFNSHCNAIPYTTASQMPLFLLQYLYHLGKEMIILSKRTASISFRIDADIKDRADKLFQEMGLNMTTAFNVFLRQSIREGRIPFEITVNIPNPVTVAALQEADQIISNPNVKRYTDVNEALRELKS